MAEARGMRKTRIGVDVSEVGVLKADVYHYRHASARIKICGGDAVDLAEYVGTLTVISVLTYPYHSIRMVAAAHTSYVHIY